MEGMEKGLPPPAPNGGQGGMGMKKASNNNPLKQPPLMPKQNIVPRGVQTLTKIGGVTGMSGAAGAGSRLTASNRIGTADQRTGSWSGHDDHMLAAIITEFGQNWFLAVDVMRFTCSMQVGFGPKFSVYLTVVHRKEREPHSQRYSIKPHGEVAVTCSVS